MLWLDQKSTTAFFCAFFEILMPLIGEKIRNKRKKLTKTAFLYIITSLV